MYYRCSLVRCRPMLHVTFYVFTLRPSSAVAMVYHFQSSMVVRSFRLLFSFVSSFNTFSLPSINYSASVPHNKISESVSFPLTLHRFAPSPPRSISSSIPIRWFHQSLLFCLRAIFWLLWFHYGRFLGAVAVAVLLHFQRSVRVVCLWSRQYSILDWFIRPLTFILHYFIEPVGVQHFIIDLQIVSSIVGVQASRCYFHYLIEDVVFGFIFLSLFCY
jgi:hypothetical protein